MTTPTWMTHAFIREIPKSDLHVHLDGSLRMETLIDLARAQKVKLPSFTVEGLRETVFKDRYVNLGEYLTGFQYTCAVMRDPESLERIAYELALDNFEEGVRYIEPRFAPQLHASSKLTIEDVLIAVNKGLERAQREINQKKKIREGKEPSFEYAIIGCAMRKFGKQFSPYYERFIHLHQYTPIEEVYPLASLELVRALAKVRDKRGLPITGFDLAGEEKGWPANAHRQAYAYAQYHFLKKTVHAGEAYGPSSIFQAITRCHANRIGHGTYLFHSELVEHVLPEEREEYVRALVEYISSRRITIEVCPTSNLQTIQWIQHLGRHPLKEMIKRKMSLTICTDNRLVSNTTVCKEIQFVLEAIPVHPVDLKNIVIYGFKRSFAAMPYPEKRSYVRKVINFYESIEKKFSNAK